MHVPRLVCEHITSTWYSLFYVVLFLHLMLLKRESQFILISFHKGEAFNSSDSGFVNIFLLAPALNLLVCSVEELLSIVVAPRRESYPAD